MNLLVRISEELQRGDDEQVQQLVQQALAEGRTPAEVLGGGLVAGMDVIGEQFGLREIFLPDVLLAARAMHAGLDVLRPHLAREGVPTAGTVVLGSVKGDLHDIGKNLVGIMLQGAGFEVVDLGNDVPAQRFIEAAERSGAKVIGMSALLTTTMPGMGKVVDLVRSSGLSGQVKTIIGGAPVSESFAREIGADAYAFDAASAVQRVRSLVATP